MYGYIAKQCNNKKNATFIKVVIKSFCLKISDVITIEQNKINNKTIRNNVLNTCFMLITVVLCRLQRKYQV